MPSDRRYAIVTGSASGLGRAICLRLARDGWHLALCDLDADENAATLKHVELAGGSGRLERLDVGQPADWQALAERLQSDWPRIDLLVNNAGIAGSGEVGVFPLDDWRKLIEVNLLGGIYGCHTLVEWMKQNPRGGHIINTASLAAYASAPAMGAYNVSKAGMLALSETLYAELKKDGIGVTVLCPAFFPTRLLTHGWYQSEDQRKVGENSMARSPFTADDVAEAAVSAMYRKQLYVVLAWRARWIWRLKRWVPRFFMNFLARSYAKGLPETV